jgi:hypothetical protein
MAELHAGKEREVSWSTSAWWGEREGKKGEQTHQTTPYAPSPTTSILSTASLTSWSALVRREGGLRSFPSLRVLHRSLRVQGSRDRRAGRTLCNPLRHRICVPASWLVVQRERDERWERKGDLAEGREREGLGAMRRMTRVCGWREWGD